MASSICRNNRHHQAAVDLSHSCFCWPGQQKLFTDCQCRLLRFMQVGRVFRPYGGGSLFSAGFPLLLEFFDWANKFE